MSAIVLQTVTEEKKGKTVRIPRIKVPVQECIICVEPLNKSTNKSVQCEYCDFVACRSCCQRHLLEIPEPKCMNTRCGRVWTRKHLSNVMTVKFLTKEYAAHREEILFNNEKLLLPATQARIMEKRARKELLLQLYKERKQLENDRYKVYIILNKQKIQDAVLLEEVNRQYDDLTLQLAHLEARINALREGHADPSDNSGRRIKLHIACPITSCRGFLDEDWKCGLCASEVCASCHMAISGAHSCKSEDIETAKVIKNETRPCPKCSANIYKLDRCEQM